ncbi:spermatogenesis-associated protein 5-like protein 1 isoform X2 [Actinia tenebrosa]|uniref:Spermatogenesis-associated protein 5-like protein 1 isoform X2 n=1 Tax=Actinia tenebrosa TaxID=6105 RepID=A0A6P8HEP1_ACTTE|nr:spermatogenesis-associated protein 5-like protein 1 isoform X2 [Actinia tenebrosa]
MADESTKTEILQCFPCEAKDYNKARCRMDMATMSDLGVIIGSSVRIRTDKFYVYCSVWPREGRARIIQFDSMVSLYFDKTEQRAAKKTLNQTSIAMTDISKLEPIEAAAVKVSLILKDIGDDCSYFSKTILDKRRERKVKMLLQGLTIVKGCVIKPRELRNNESSIYREIYSVTVEETMPIISDAGCVTVSANTTIHVQSVRMGSLFGEGNRFTMAGMDEASKILKEMLKYPFEYPESFAHLDLECPKGILLQGAPGVGKTLLVRTVTDDCNAQLITVNGTDVFGPHSGESEENLRKVFEKARVASKSGPCVLFIDEIDALCPKRGTSGSEEENRIVAQLLTLMDGVDNNRGRLVVIGATNRPNAIDSALRRPGRFDREVVIGVPSPLNRLAILQVHTRNLQLDEDVNLAHLAEITVGYVGADLASLCREAAIAAMKRTFQEEGGPSLSLQKGFAKASSVKMTDFQLAMCHIVPSTHRGMEGLVSLHPISWQSIGGLHQVKQALMQAIEWPLKYPEAFSRLGLQRPRGVMLYGPPGCCKTTLVRAVASSCHCTFLSLSCAQLYSPYVGDAERMIREIFLKARATAPSILFLDELDSLAGKRSEKDSSGPQTRLLASLLNEMDGVGVSANIYGSDHDRNSKQTSENKISQDGEGKCDTDLKEDSGEDTNDGRKQRLSKLQNVKDLILVAATNRPGAIDEALLRPGRIDRIIYVPPPNQDARLEILKVLTRASPVSDDVSLKNIAENTEMFSGADLENLLREAALFALEENGMTASNIEQKHFTKALATVKPSLTIEQLNYYKNW